MKKQHKYEQEEKQIQRLRGEREPRVESDLKLGLQPHDLTTLTRLTDGRCWRVTAAVLAESN